MNCKHCGNPADETYPQLLGDYYGRRPVTYGPSYYCRRCGMFFLVDDLDNTRPERAGNND